MGGFRRGAVNKGLLVLLGLLAIGAIVFYTWKSKSESAGPPDPNEPTEVQIWCDEEQVWIAVKNEDASNLERENDKMKCPQCKKFSASFNRPAKPTPEGKPKVLAP